MKRLNFTILTVFILVISLSINTINCFASEPYFDDLVDAELATQEAIDMYNYYLSSDIVRSYLEEINSYKYVVAKCDVYSSYSYMRFYCFNDDIVLYKYFAEVEVLGVISKAESISYKMFYFQINNSDTNPDGSLKVKFNSSNSLQYDTKFTFGNITYTTSPHYYGLGGMDGYVRCDVPVYQNKNEAVLALEGNDIKPLYGDTISYSQDSVDKLYFKSFNVIPHVGTDLNASYFTFNYELSDYAKQHKDNLAIYISSQYSFGIVGNPIAEQYLRSDTWGNIINLSNDSGYFTLCCSDIKSLVDFKNKWQFSDDNIIGRMKTFDIANTFAHAICPDLNIVEITTSFLSFTIQLRTRDSNNKYISGQWKSFTYDFLTHQSNTAGVVPEKDSWLSNENPTYIVDANGTQSHNSYFYEDTVTNADNSTTTKYYYTDGDKTTEITYNQYTNNEVPSGMSNPWVINAEGGNSLAEGGSAVANATASIGDIIINIPPQGGGNSDYITIEDDDLTSEGLIAAISHGFGYFDNIDTGEKGDGLIALISGLYGYLPGDLASMTMFGLATTFGIIIIRRILNK